MKNGQKGEKVRDSDTNHHRVHRGKGQALHAGDDAGNNTSTSAQVVARYRARQFNQSWNRGTPEYIEGLDVSTPYMHQTPAGKPRLDWTPSPDHVLSGRAVRASMDSDAPTPVLRPEQASFLSPDYSSTNDSIDSARGCGNGEILVGKIRELQQRLEASEREKEMMKDQIKALKAGNIPVARNVVGGGGDESEAETVYESDHDSMSATLERSKETPRGSMSDDEGLDSSRKSLDFQGKQAKDTGSGCGPPGHENLAPSLASSGSSSDAMSDDQMIQAMSKITHGVHQLEGALRRHLSLSTGSTSSSSHNFALTNGSDSSDRQMRSSSRNNSAGQDLAGSLGASGEMLLCDVICGHGTPLWWSRLQCGDVVDGRDKDRRWYIARIESIEGREDQHCSEASKRAKCSASPRASPGFRVKISFEGWSSDWDIWLHSQKDVAELAPRGTHVELAGARIAARGSEITSYGLENSGRELHNRASGGEHEGSQGGDDCGQTAATSIATSNVSSDFSGSVSTDISGASPHSDMVKSSWELNTSLSPVEFALSGRDQLTDIDSRPASELRGGSIMMRARVRAWKVADVSAWIGESLELPQYKKLFAKASVDGVTLMRLHREDLESMGVKDKIHSLKILSHLDHIKL